MSGSTASGRTARRSSPRRASRSMGWRSEQLRVAVEMAMARNPRLRVLRIREASVMDEDSVALLRELARERGWQLWLERIEPA